MWHFFICSAESIGNSAGLGFSGYDEKGNPEWETSKNCQPIGFEVCIEVDICFCMYL